jgi:hypothetical protein
MGSETNNQDGGSEPKSQPTIWRDMLVVANIAIIIAVVVKMLRSRSDDNRS